MLLEDARALMRRLEVISKQRGAVAGLVIPVHKTDKKPDGLRHRGGRWSESTCAAYFEQPDCKVERLGIILQNLFVIDCDSAASHSRVTTLFPELLAAPAETTRKGVHIFLWRSEAIERAGLTDGPLVDPMTGAKCEIDRKTRTRKKEDGHYTGGLLVCSPSPNYAWLPGRSLLELDPPDPSEELVAWLVARTPESKKRKRVVKSVSAPVGSPADATPHEDEELAPAYDIAGCARRAHPGGALLLAPDKDDDKRDVLAMFTTGGECEEPQPYAAGEYPGASFKYKGTCPLCKAKVHDNCFYYFWSPLGVRWLRTHSVRYGSCTVSAQGVRVPYQPRSLASYQRRMDKALDACARRLDSQCAARVLEVLRLVDAVREACAEEGGTPLGWWDSEASSLYVRLPAPAGRAQHYAVITSACLGDCGVGQQCCRVRLTAKPWALACPVEVTDIPLNPRRSNALRAAAGLDEWVFPVFPGCS